jgi:hypothetical protein
VIDNLVPVLVSIGFLYYVAFLVRQFGWESAFNELGYRLLPVIVGAAVVTLGCVIVTVTITALISVICYAMLTYWCVKEWLDRSITTLTEEEAG